VKTYLKKKKGKAFYQVNTIKTLKLIMGYLIEDRLNQKAL
jgi:hypothetical protein